MNKTPYIFLLMLLMCFSLVYGTDIKNKESNLVKAWPNYQSTPTSDNAYKVYVLLPLELYQEVKINTRIFEDSLTILEKQVLLCDTNSIKLAFRLHTIADGSFGETLDITLGKLIRINPTLFLMLLQEHRKFIVRLDCLLGNFGMDYVDKYAEQKREIQLRIKSLKKIKHKGLEKVKKECISELEGMLVRYEK